MNSFVYFNYQISGNDICIPTFHIWKIIMIYISATKIRWYAHMNYFHRGFHTWNQSLEHVVATAAESVSDLPTNDPSYSTPKTRNHQPTGKNHVGRFEYNFKWFAANFIAWCLVYLLWNCPEMNVSGPHCCQATLVQVIALCRRAKTSHYQSQCWRRFMLPFGVTNPQWDNHTKLPFIIITHFITNDMINVPHFDDGKIVCRHYSDVIMSPMASQITSLMIVYSIVYSVADRRKHQSSASLASVRGIHRWIPCTKGP